MRTYYEGLSNVYAPLSIRYSFTHNSEVVKATQVSFGYVRPHSLLYFLICWSQSFNGLISTSMEYLWEKVIKTQNFGLTSCFHLVKPLNSLSNIITSYKIDVLDNVSVGEGLYIWKNYRVQAERKRKILDFFYLQNMVLWYLIL